MEGLNLLRAQFPAIDFVLNGSEQFEDIRRTFNDEIKPAPAAIVRVKTVEDVCNVVKFCAANSMPISVRSGGNDLFVRSLVEGGLTIDMRALNAVHVDPQSMTVTVGGGIDCGTIAQALTPFSCVTPMPANDW